MNYFTEAENVLSNLVTLQTSLKNLERRKQRIINASSPKDIQAIDYEKQYCAGAYVNDTYGDILEVAATVREIVNTKAKIEEIESVIEQLSLNDYRRVVKMWYVQKKSKESIMRALSYSSLKTVYDLRNRAVTQFALLYFGASAL